MDNLEICPECIGEGYPNFCDDEPCPTCAGRGRVTPERKEEYYQDLWNTESPAYRRYIERNKAELEQMVEKE